MSRKKNNGFCGNFLWIIILFGMISSCFSKDNKVEDDSKIILNPTPTHKIVRKYNKESISRYSTNTPIPKAKQSYIKNKYHSNDVINQLIKDYNKNAECIIEKGTVQNGAYPTSAHLSCNGVWISIYDSLNLYVDFNIETWSDAEIFVVFRDFLTTMDDTINENDIINGWKELQTGKYTGYNYYYIGNVQCSYWEHEISNGMKNYTVKTGLIIK